jgi:hypothetical protein
MDIFKGLKQHYKEIIPKPSVYIPHLYTIPEGLKQAHIARIKSKK